MSNRCAVCSIPCETSCGHCKKVLYCSVDHQKSHRRKHKEECFPAIEKENGEFGRYFVATRNIKPLEVIWTEKPVIIAPYDPRVSAEVLPMCLGCCVVLPGTLQTGFSKCSLCNWPLCSPSCTGIHWHSLFECELFRLNKMKPLDFSQNPLIYLAIKILRMIILKRQHSKKWDKIISLKPNTDAFEISKFKSEGLPFDVVANFFTDCICNRCNLNEDPQLIKKVFNICNRYARRRRVNQDVLPGRKFSSIISEKKGKLMHSCGPNTVPIISDDRSKEILYATADIKPGGILTHAHEFDPVGMNFPGQVERRSVLLENFEVWCKCSLCMDPTEQGTFYSAIKCQKEIGGRRCPGYFLPRVVTNRKTPIELQNEKWQCDSPSCKAQKTYSKLKKVVESIQNKVEALGDHLEKKLHLIDEIENVTLHENHFLITKLRFSLLPHMLFYFGRLCEEKNITSPALLLYAADILKKYALKCLEISDKFHPGSTLLRGVLLFFVVAENTLRVKYNLSNPQPSEKMEKLRSEAMSILKLVTEGAYGSYLYKQLQTEILIDRVYLNGAQY